MRILSFALLTAFLFSCGDDGLKQVFDASPSDASASDATSADSAVDAAAQVDANTSGTQGEGQFCETLAEGGPYCIDGLTCCGDKICRSDCGSGGGIACTGKADCNGGDVCCLVDASQFCTPKKSCGDFGGTEVP